MCKSWGNERIYCSEITKRLLEDRFPNLTNVTALKLNEKYEIPLNADETIRVNVTFFNANHCIGSVMILFDGFMGTIFHTGDFRFSPRMITDL
mmetsp:Transcript_11933/g.10302  ORF Transcript_11933/g.10302 Transcript_11933/m.10302 type:complete len:93 (-) Transcript_11933:1417-1695(-)